jgi:hypothetical protein
MPICGRSLAARIEPVWNAERKDELEARMCSLACSGQLDVVEAQRAIADDWTEAFRRFVGEPKAASLGGAP